MRVKISLVLILLFSSVLEASDLKKWPGQHKGTNIGKELPNNPLFEASGVAWVENAKSFFVVDDQGRLARMGSNGESTTTWWVLGRPDLEAVTVIEKGDSFTLYLGVEYDYNTKSAQILEIKPPFGPESKPLVPTRTWNLPSENFSLNGKEHSEGMEALVWVPNGFHRYEDSASGGLFYAGSQFDGSIEVYDVNLEEKDATPVLITTFSVKSGWRDLADLSFSRATATLFLLYDEADALVEYDPRTQKEKVSYDLPKKPKDQEGVAVQPTNCSEATTVIVLANDHGGLYSFIGFPQPCTANQPPTEADLTADVVGDDRQPGNTKERSGKVRLHGSSLPAQADLCSGRDLLPVPKLWWGPSVKLHRDFGLEGQRCDSSAHGIDG